MFKYKGVLYNKTSIDYGDDNKYKEIWLGSINNKFVCDDCKKHTAYSYIKVGVLHTNNDYQFSNDEDAYYRADNFTKLYHQCKLCNTCLKHRFMHYPYPYNICLQLSDTKMEAIEDIIQD